MRTILNKGAKTSPFMIFVGIAVVALLVFAVFQISQTQIGPAKEVAIKEAADCEQQPILDVNLVNALDKSSAIATDVHAIVNGQVLGNVTADGTSSAVGFARGDNVELLATAPNYIDMNLGTVEMECGINTVGDEIFATSGNTFRVFNSDGNPVTDVAAGGTVNQSSSASPITMRVSIDSTSDESTGDLVIVIESTNTTQVDDIVLSGAGVEKTVVPEFYASNAAGSISKAYKVPALKNGESKDFTLLIEPESGITIGTGDPGNSIYITAYSAQEFTTKEGTFTSGIENVDGTTKYEDTWDFDFGVS